MSRRFSAGERIASFRHAVAGLIALLKDQHNARVHLAATVIVIGLAAYLDVSRGQWAALCMAIALVWLAEALNSAIEYLADATHPEQHPLIGKAKDVAAAGVLIAAIAAAAVGIAVFLPYLRNLHAG